jgi:hypothetical protein
MWMANGIASHAFYATSYPVRGEFQGYLVIIELVLQGNLGLGSWIRDGKIVDGSSRIVAIGTPREVLHLLPPRTL